MMKLRKICAILLIGSVLLSTAACGSTEGESAFEQEAATETEASDTGEENQTVTAETDLTYGNDPNNLYQLWQAPCFGDGRAYYVNFNNEVASFSLDGSDYKIHGSVTVTDEDLTTPKYLNWYNGAVYYMLTQYNEDYTSYVEIRCMDPETGEETVVETCESGDLTAHGMEIIGDHLVYAILDSNDDTTTVQVKNLASGETNELFHKGTSGSGAGNAVFTTDGANLYMVIPDQLSKVYSLPLSELYSVESAGDPIVALSTEATIFTEEGIYSSVRNDNDDWEYVFYAYQDFSEDWPCEVVKEDLIADGESATEEDIINNLVWYSEKWMLGDAMVSVSQMNKNLYYSASVDYTQSTSCGELAFEKSAANGTGKYIGEYENVLYVICQDGEETSFHTLTADGTFQ